MDRFLDRKVVAEQIAAGEVAAQEERIGIDDREKKKPEDRHQKPAPARENPGETPLLLEATGRRHVGRSCANAGLE